MMTLEEVLASGVPVWASNLGTGRAGPARVYQRRGRLYIERIAQYGATEPQKEQVEAEQYGTRWTCSRI